MKTLILSVGTRWILTNQGARYQKEMIVIENEKKIDHDGNIIMDGMPGSPHSHGLRPEDRMCHFVSFADEPPRRASSPVRVHVGLDALPVHINHPTPPSEERLCHFVPFGDGSPKHHVKWKIRASGIDIQTTFQEVWWWWGWISIGNESIITA